MDGRTCSAVLFDLDGTLVDSAAEIAAAVNETLTPLHGGAVMEVSLVRSWIGNGLGKLFRRALGHCGVAAEDLEEAVAAHWNDFLLAYGRHCGTRSTLYPGVVNCLGALRRAGLQLGVVTNKDAGFTEKLLRAHGIRCFFDAVVSGDTLAVKKPDPETLWSALRALDARAEDALFVGDSIVDLRTGAAAGVRTWAVRHGYHHGEFDQPLAQALRQQRFVSGFAEIAALLTSPAPSIPIHSDSGAPLPAALIFDVDGTLADTENPGHRRAFNEAFETLGFKDRWNEALYHKLLRVAGGKERLRHFWRELGRPEAEDAELIDRLHALKTQIYLRLVRAGDIALRPGVEWLLRTARQRGIKLAIATTTTRANVETLLRLQLGAESIGWFEVIACADDAPTKKPAPDVYQFVLRRLGLSPAQVIVFEDNDICLRAARAAGVARVVITPTAWSREEDFGYAWQVLGDLTEFDLRGMAQLPARKICA